MNQSSSAQFLNALKDLRHSIGLVAALCDAMILGSSGDRASAPPKLPRAIRRLIARAERTLHELEEHP